MSTVRLISLSSGFVHLLSTCCFEFAGLISDVFLGGCSKEKQVIASTGREDLEQERSCMGVRERDSPVQSSPAGDPEKKKRKRRWWSRRGTWESHAYQGYYRHTLLSESVYLPFPSLPFIIWSDILLLPEGGRKEGSTGGYRTEQTGSLWLRNPNIGTCDERGGDQQQNRNPMAEKKKEKRKIKCKRKKRQRSDSSGSGNAARSAISVFLFYPRILPLSLLAALLLVPFLLVRREKEDLVIPFHSICYYRTFSGRRKKQNNAAATACSSSMQHAAALNLVRIFKLKLPQANVKKTHYLRGTSVRCKIVRILTTFIPRTSQRSPQSRLKSINKETNQIS